MYRCGLLTPARAENAMALNSALLGPRTLGIEVTEPDLAARCGLGNIDPQHTTGGADRAAIEECCVVSLPPIGATLCTIRPDLDAVGGMAVLALRVTGEGLSPEALDRVRQVACADRFARGAWPGPRPLPEHVDDLDDEAMPAVAAIAGAVADRRVVFPNRVVTAARWLRTGEEPSGYRAAWRSERQLLLAMLGTRALRVTSACGGHIALVDATVPGAVSLGYRLAPVVVARNPAFTCSTGLPYLKYTVAQYDLSHVDMVQARRDLASLEPGWGGSATILGSPQGVSSRLPLGTVIDAVAKTLRHSAGRSGDATPRGEPLDLQRCGK